MSFRYRVLLEDGREVTTTAATPTDAAVKANLCVPGVDVVRVEHIATSPTR